VTDWILAAELPNLRRAGVIALDIETLDRRLNADKGSGWPSRDGHICGISVAYRAGADIRAHYIPPRVYQWLRDLIASDVRIVAQNGLYDYGWLRTEAGIKMPPGERVEEIGALATLIDENRFKYSLDALCTWRGLPGRVRGSFHKSTSGNCQRAMSDPMPRPTPSTHFCCAKISIQSLTKKAPAPPIGLNATFSRWCWKCACAASGSTSMPPSKRALCC
jgi:hypothetical protein